MPVLAFPSAYDQQPLNMLTEEHLDLTAALARFRLIDSSANIEKLRKLGILVPVEGRWVPSIGGLILFGQREARRRWVSAARVCCARFVTADKSYLLDEYNAEATILDVLEMVLAFVRRNTRLAAETLSLVRNDISEYPMAAVREVLINAMVHADYARPGVSIQVAIFDGRLEIQSPGGFPSGFTLQDFERGVSRIRNRVIADVFRELKLMEQKGGGYQRILAACQEGGYPAPQWDELSTSLRVTFYSHPKTVLSHQFVRQPMQQQWVMEDSDYVPDRKSAILRLFESGESLPFRVIVKRLGLPLSDRMLRYELKALKEQGLLETHGEGRALVWRRRNS